MLYEQTVKKHPFATLLTFQAGSAQATLFAAHPTPGMEPIQETIALPRAVVRRGPAAMAPTELFTLGMFAYVTVEDQLVSIERSGCVVQLPLEGTQAYRDGEVVMVDAGAVISQLNVDYQWTGNQCQVIVEARTNGPRSLTPAEERLPYAKYYHRYWDTPFHLRPDFITWGKKAGLYAGGNMQDPSRMLHISQINKLMDRTFREQEWHEGWTLFDDGTGVMCARTEFPGTTAEMFKWWFAWHVKEDLRYMLWCPPSHYGISPSLELRRRVENPNLSLNEKTRGMAVHHVYEYGEIDAISYKCAAPLDYFDIVFYDPKFRGLTEENIARFDEEGIAAVCGNDRMLHFFANNPDGSGGVLYSHFWFGLRRNEAGVWVGGTPGEGKNYKLMIPLMMIAQHANKEFPLLADILPSLYAEEGHKPL